MDALFLNSGGLDSLAVARWGREAGHVLYSLFIDVGQENVELAAQGAIQIAAAEQLSHETVLVRWSGGPLLATQKGLSWLGTPFSGPVFFSLGATVARTKGLDFLVSGMRYGTEDQDTTFCDAFVALLRTSPWTHFVTPIRPLSGQGYDEIVARLAEDPVAHATYSCARIPRCGTCRKCETRRRYGIDPTS